MTRGRLAAATACLTLAGCGGSGHHRAQRVSPPIIQSADCRVWVVMGSRERTSLLAQLRSFYGGPVDSSGGPNRYGTVLSNDRATALFDSYCKQPFAGAFKLYKLYARAAAFSVG